MFKLIVALFIGLGAVYAFRHLSLPPVVGSAGQSPFSTAQMAPIPGLDPNPHPMSENLHPLGPPQIKPLDLGNANATAAASELRRLDQQGVSGSWAFPQNRRP